MDDASVLDALGECWQMWHETLRALEPEQWAAPTRATGWDVKSLATHHAGWVLGFAALRDRQVGNPRRLTTAVELLRRFNAPDGVAVVGAADIERQTREFAATLATEQLVAAFAEVAPAALAEARELGAAAAVDYVGVATMTIGEVANIGVLEATVHGLDLLHAVGLPADRTPAAAEALVADLLVALPGRLAFIEAATGRRGGVFPVLH